MRFHKERNSIGFTVLSCLFPTAANTANIADRRIFHGAQNRHFQVHVEIRRSNVEETK